MPGCSLAISDRHTRVCALYMSVRERERERIVVYFYIVLDLRSFFFCPLGRSKKKDKCKNTQMYPLSETQYCPCDKYNALPVGNWSDCILPEDGRVESILAMRVQGDFKECGQGYRYQAMVCYDQENRLVETSRCNSHGNAVCVHVCVFVCVWHSPPDAGLIPPEPVPQGTDVIVWCISLITLALDQVVNAM